MFLDHSINSNSDKHVHPSTIKPLVSNLNSFDKITLNLSEKLVPKLPLSLGISYILLIESKNCITGKCTFEHFSLSFPAMLVNTLCWL